MCMYMYGISNGGNLNTATIDATIISAVAVPLCGSLEKIIQNQRNVANRIPSTSTINNNAA